MAYGDMLIRAYEGEVAGQAFFATLARARDVWREKQELHFLAALEARTAAALEPLLRRDRLKAR